MGCYKVAGIDFTISFDTIHNTYSTQYEEMPMKIEKVNDNQIRCTLTKADLADRELKLSELAYGTEKAKGLFRDMMQQAALEFGFQADNIPLMIEAIPINAECIVLIITKVEDPEELDTRFSRFAPEMDDNDDVFEDDSEEEAASLAHAKDEVLGLFKRLTEEVSGALDSVKNGQTSNGKSLDKPFDKDLDKKSDNKADAKEATESAKHEVYTKMFTFDSMSEVIKPAVALKDIYDDRNSLYKDSAKGKYVLVVNLENGTKENFNKACNILSEHGRLERTLPSREYYYKEHYECVISDDAIQKLSQVM